MSELLILTLTIIGVNIALLGVITTLMIWAVNRVDQDVKSLCTRMDANGVRMDAFSVRMDGHAARIDQLYRMFVDLLKEVKK